MVNAQSVQYSWFTKDIQKESVQSFYKEIAGSEPNTINQNLKISPIQPFLAQAIGVFDEYNFEVRMESNRIDLVVTKSINANSPFGIFDLENLLNKLLDRITSFDKDDNLDVNRIAIISKLSEQMNALDEANSYLLKLCDLKLDQKNMTDFLFRYNRRKILEGAEINKHVTYVVDTIDELILQNTNQLKANTLYFANIILDFNTVPIIKPTKISFNKLWKELVKLSVLYKNNPSVKYQESIQ